jgi:(hydroxyamino)benzene mutase
MNAANLLSRQGHRLLQVGVWLFVFSGVEGFFIPSLPYPPLGRSVHTLSGLEGVITLALGLFWPRLRLGPTASKVAFWTYLYSSLGTLIPFILAAVWGAGNTTMPLAAGPARGTALQEAIIRDVVYTAPLPFFVSMGLILWGLRMVDSQPTMS